MVHRLVMPCTKVEIDGKAFDINTDFLVWIEIENTFFDESKSEERRLAEVLVLAYPVLPDNPVEAVRKVLWFYSGGRYSDCSDEKTKVIPLYNLEKDFEYVWTSFQSEYGIDISETRLHWWKFMALLGGLGENCSFSRIIGYRSLDVSSIKDKNIRSFYEKMKNPRK